MKKLFALVLSLMMALALCAPAMAEDLTVIGFASQYLPWVLVPAF